MTGKKRVLVRRLKKGDFKLETFCTGGKGGQHQNKNQTGIRIRHPESGAVGESREHKSQVQNRRAALIRLSETKQFQLWARMEVAKSLGIPTPEEAVEKMMKTFEDFKVEVKDGKGRWTEVPWDSIIPGAHVTLNPDTGELEILEAEK